jgi:ribosomal protein L10
MPKKTCTKKNRQAKVAQWNAIQDACAKYNKIMFVDVDNVTSAQICVLRRALRPIGAQIVMGKNVS